MVERHGTPDVNASPQDVRLDELLWPDTAPFAGRLGEQVRAQQNLLEYSADEGRSRSSSSPLPVVRPLAQHSPWRPLQETVRSERLLPQRGLAIGTAPELELITVPPQALKQLLQDSGSAAGVVGLLEIGVKSGALQVLGERLLLTRSAPVGETPARGFDISGLVREMLERFIQDEGAAAWPLPSPSSPGGLRSLLQRWMSAPGPGSEDHSAREQRSVSLPGATQALARASSGTMPLRGSLPEPQAATSGRQLSDTVRQVDGSETPAPAPGTALHGAEKPVDRPGQPPAIKSPLGEAMPLLKMPAARTGRTPSPDADSQQPPGRPPPGRPSPGQTPDTARERVPLAARGRAGAFSAQTAPRPKPTIHTDRELGRPRGTAMSGTGPTPLPRAPLESPPSGRPMMVESTLSELARQVQRARRQEQEEAHDRTF